MQLPSVALLMACRAVASIHDNHYIMCVLMDIMEWHTMTMQPEPIAWERLKEDEVDNLPRRVRGRLGKSVEFDDEWIVLHAPGWPLGSLIDRLNRLYRMWPQATVRESREHRLERALAWLVEAGPGIEAELALDNLELRKQYMDETPMLTAAQIHRMSGLGSTNTSEPASRWKAEGKTFAIRLRGRDHYPAFQFQDGSPRPVIKAVLAALPAAMTPWQTALWFASGNGWLDGDEPRRRLDDGDPVVEAARNLAESARG